MNRTKIVNKCLIIAIVTLFIGMTFSTSSLNQDNASSTVPVKDDLVAYANGPYEGEVGEDIQFNGSASGGMPPYSYVWDFGDGNMSDEQNPVHMYNEAGVYNVTLFVSDDTGKTVNDTTNATIADTTLPTVKIIKPERAIYLHNKKIREFDSPIVIGGIDVIVDALDTGSGIKEVRFYIDGQLKKTVNSSSYKWTWNERIFFGHTLSVEVLDNNGNKAEDSIAVFVINAFPDIKLGILKGKVEFEYPIRGMQGVPLVKVTAESVSDSFTKHKYTKIIPPGNFILRLPTGTYTITVEKNRFITQQREVEVILGDNEFLHFELQKS